MANYKCIRCGKEISYDNGQTVKVCDCCGNKLVLPMMTSEAVERKYASAIDSFREGKFDEASETCKEILKLQGRDPVGHWIHALCEYGVVYRKDLASGEWVFDITRNRSVNVDQVKHLVAAVKLSRDNLQWEVLFNGVERLEEVRKESEKPTVVSEPNNETTQPETIKEETVEPEEIKPKDKPHKKMNCDVFVSYKQTDNETNKNTNDALHAEELYRMLRDNGYHVFYAPVVLQGKLGEKYKPYLQGAIDAARIMIVLGTKPEHFVAPWIRSEWEQFLELMDNEGGRLLIPLIDQMNPDDLPDALRQMQTMTMGDGWKEVIEKRINEFFVQWGMNKHPLFIKALNCLFSEDYTQAEIMAEKIMNACEPDDEQYSIAQAYANYIRLMIKFKAKSLYLLSESEEHFYNCELFRLAYEDGDEYLQGILEKCRSDSKQYQQQKEIYDKAVETMDSADSVETWQLAADEFSEITDFADAQERMDICLEEAKEFPYNSGMKSMGENTIEGYYRAMEIFQGILEHPGVEEKIEECRKEIDRLEKQTFEEAFDLMEQGTAAGYSEAIDAFHKIRSYRETERLARYCDHAAEQAKKYELIESSIIDLSAGEYDKAIERLNEIKDWEHVDDLIHIAQLLQNDDNEPEELQEELEETQTDEIQEDTQSDDTQIDDMITFGHYLQEEETPTPIVWKVLAKKDNKLLLISRNVLDCQPFNKGGGRVTWETCSLRKWLNEVFLREAFTEEETRMICTEIVKADKNPEYDAVNQGEDTDDKVFMLSVQEAKDYFTDDAERVGEATRYVVKKKPRYFRETDRKCKWWLRTLGRSNNVSNISPDGLIYEFGNYVTKEDTGIRPAIWVDLNPEE